MAHLDEGELLPDGRKFYSRLISIGWCTDTAHTAVVEAQRRLFPGFRRRPRGSSLVLYDPRISEAVVDEVVAGVNAADAVVGSFLRTHFEPASVYVYHDVGQAARTSCVTRLDQPFFSGAIFLVAAAAEDDAARGARRDALVHAVTHHALTQQGLRGPAWLQEGLAMFVANEVWWLDPSLGLREWGAATHLPFATMVDVSPHTASQRPAAAALYQSLTMVQAVNHARGEGRLPELVEAIVRHQVKPEDAYAWALGGAPGEEERAWRAAVENQVVSAGFYRNTAAQ